MLTVDVSHLYKSFGSVQAVEDVSFSVEPGEIFGLLGPNGAGKTTTIRMMLDIFKPDSGTVSVFGGPLDLEKKRRIGYLPEERGLYKDERVESTLIYLATLKGLDKATARRRVRQWLERMELTDHRDKKTQELSKGMQQKAQLIATLVHEPELIVIDEPFSGLDPVNTRLVKDILAEQRIAGRVIIMCTHQMHQVEELCNRIVLISKGRALLYGRVDDIKRNFAGNAVKVKGHGDFTHIPGVLEARHINGAWQMALQVGVDPQTVLRSLVTFPNTKIERFELAAPSLDDIFINVVQNKETQAKVPHA